MNKSFAATTIAPLFISACVTTGTPSPVTQSAPAPTAAQKPVPQKIVRHGLNDDQSCAEAQSRNKAESWFANIRSSATGLNGECVSILAGIAIKGSNLVNTEKPTASFYGRIGAPSCDETNFASAISGLLDKDQERKNAFYKTKCEAETSVAKIAFSNKIARVIKDAAQAAGVPTKAITVEIEAPSELTDNGMFDRLKKEFNIQGLNLPTPASIGNKAEGAANTRANQIGRDTGNEIIRSIK